MESQAAAGRDIRARLAGRTEDAFAEEERLGLMLAAKTRTIALAVVLLWQVVDNPNVGLAYAVELLEVLSFAALGLLQFLCARQRFHMRVLKYAFVLVDCALLAFIFTVEHPFVDHVMPPALKMEGSRFAFFFIFLMQAAFSLRPGLVLWCGFCIAAARTAMLLWIAGQPGVFTNLDLPERTVAAFLDAAMNPNFVYLGHWITEVIAVLIVAAGLAVVVKRSRRLVESRAIAERTRASLARYFSPNVVDHLGESEESLRQARAQDVAVLFADIMDFTALCEKQAADDVVALLRDYHARLGQAVFDNGGTLDKYIGDGLMATFGTPEPGSDDAGNALRCAFDMMAALRAWNAEHTANGAPPIRVGIGLHFGPVIAGDIGNERRLEYSVIGDTVNTASRLEHLTRELGAGLVVSDDLVKAIPATDGEARELLQQLSAAGTQRIRGRETGVAVWIAGTGSVSYTRMP